MFVYVYLFSYLFIFYITYKSIFNILIITFLTFNYYGSFFFLFKHKKSVEKKFENSKGINENEKRLSYINICIYLCVFFLHQFPIG